MQELLLSIKGLHVQTADEPILQDLNLDIAPGELVGILGASGCGKTTLGLSIMGLLPEAMRCTAGSILYHAQDLMAYKSKAWRQVRGKEIGFVFQDPLSSWNPLQTIGYQIQETLLAHESLSRKVSRVRVLEILRHVEIEDPERIYDSYPHQVSGGQRQRAMIACAIICKPRLLIADEPTSSLDVLVAAKIIGLFRRLHQEGLAMLFITHDLGLLAHLASRVVVMDQGKIIEISKPEMLLTNPKHPLTRQLSEAYAYGCD